MKLRCSAAARTTGRVSSRSPDFVFSRIAGVPSVESAEQMSFKGTDYNFLIRAMWRLALVAADLGERWASDRSCTVTARGADERPLVEVIKGRDRIRNANNFHGTPCIV